MNLLNVSKGWQCPVCGKVWSPSIPYCDCHKKRYNISGPTGDWSRYTYNVWYTKDGQAALYEYRAYGET
jgi:hypothetical protein